MSRSQFIQRPRPRAAAVAAGLALLATGAAAAPAFAGPFEQVSRATGAAGDSPFDTYKQAVWISDDGRWAVYIDRDFRAADAPVYRRDISSNTTTKIASLPKYTAIAGISRADDRVLTVSTDNVVSLRDANLKPLRTLGRYPSTALIHAALSGNGKVVAVSTGTTTIDVLSADTGKKLRTVSAPPNSGNVDLATGSAISDDGSVIAGQLGSGFGFYAKGTAPARELGSSSVVSGDGSIVAGTGPFGTNAIIVTKTADGSRREIPTPDGAAPDPITWIAPDGSSLLTGHNFFSLPKPAQKLDIRRGTWSSFGGAFGGNLSGDLTSASGATFALSHNGRFALVPFGNVLSVQLASVNLAGRDLPGSQEPVTASTYLPVDTPTVYDCSPTGTGTLDGLFAYYDAWLPKPAKATLKITVDGKVLLNRTLTDVYDATVPYAFPTDDQRFSVTFPGTAKAITYTATTVDVNGATATSTETSAPTRSCS